MTKNTLCLDIGTKTGYAVGQDGQEHPTQSGTIFLASEEELKTQRETGQERTGDIRFAKLESFVKDTISKYDVKRIVFEDVIFTTSQIQAQLWASLRAIVWAAKTKYNLEIQCVPVGTLKAFGGGSGNADKTKMAEGLENTHPNVWNNTMDDNEIDAVWLHYYTHAVDAGTQTWSSVWENRKKRKLEKQRKLQAKREKGKLKNQQIINDGVLAINSLLNSNSIKLTKAQILKIAKLPITKTGLQDVEYLALNEPTATLVAKITNNKIVWSLK